MLRKIFKLKILNLKDQKSFSLIELLVAMGILVLIILTATAISISVIRSQRANRAFQEVQDNGRYIMEMMVKEIRMSKIILPEGETGPETNSVVIDGTDDSCLVINNGSATENFEYCFKENKYLVKKIIDISVPDEPYVSDSLRLNSDNVDITSLKFYISDIPSAYASTNYYRRVTVAMGLQSTENSNAQLYLQTTVCSRPPICPTGICAEIFPSSAPID